MYGVPQVLRCSLENGGGSQAGILPSCTFYLHSDFETKGPKPFIQAIIS